MSEKKPYTLTDRAGPIVAGRRVKPRQPLLLTDAEAAYELREGTIRRDPTPGPEARSKPARKPFEKTPKGDPVPGLPVAGTDETAD